MTQFLDPTAARLDVFGVWFIILIGVVMPFSAVKSARRPAPPTERQRISQRLKNVLFLLALFVIALLIAWKDAVVLFPPIPITARLLTMCAAVLIAILSMAELLLATRTPEERKRLWVKQIIPRTPAERAVWLLSSTVAGVTEETIFRGVFFVLVAALTKNIIIAGLISAVVFAIGHYRQGKKSAVMIGVFALLFQWLIIMTGSLVPAMTVHALYNMIRGLVAGRRLEKLEPATP